MDRDNILLIVLFVIVLILAGFILIYDPSKIGKPENVTQVNISNQVQPSPQTPQVILPNTVSNPNDVCKTMCQFRSSTMNRVEVRNNQYFCICENGYERYIGNVP
jgi:hypothetical protein